MILKVEDAIKSLSRTDPDCEARRDLTGLYSPPLTVHGKSNIQLRYPAACGGEIHWSFLERILIYLQKFQR